MVVHRFVRSALALAIAVLPVLAAAADTQPAAGPGRLPTDVRPTFQAIHLEIDPAAAAYTGRVRVELVAQAPAAAVVFHAEQMTLTSVTLSGSEGAIAATHESGPVLTTVRPAAPLAPGRYVLEVAFSNDYQTNGLGLYKTSSGGQPYLFTQFQADEARTAFPCWDEPSFKFPYQMTLVVPEALTALSNTPVESEAVAQGRRTVVFKKTPPLPSYLLALAAGELESVPMPGTSVPARVVTVKGATPLAAEAVRMTPPLLAALERYFGRKYPFDKLDLVAASEYWYGAMENPGAIVYRDSILLLDPKAATTSQRSLQAQVTAHEIAHMWFGDLVTMAWWDDLWLNESFASWMGDKVTHQVFPEFRVDAQVVEGVQAAMASDARLSTRAIRQPVQASDNLIQGADELAYQKGQAVLAMVEAWIGEEAFRKGVIAHLAAHEWGNATAADLFAALAKASGQDVAGVLDGFLAQPGVPLVTVEAVDGRKVTLAQRRFANFGTEVPPARWRIPVALRYADGSGRQTFTVLLDAERKQVSLPGRGALTWVHPNANEVGYYRWSVPEPMLRALSGASSSLSLSERVGLVGNLAALVQAGALRADAYLRLLTALAADPEPEVVGAVVTALAGAKSAFVTAELEEPFAAYVRRTLGPPLERFGMMRRPGEAENVSALRPRLLSWLGAEGNDPRVLEQAGQWARAWLADPASIDPAVAGTALQLAALRGDKALFDTYTRRIAETKVPTQRQQLVAALGRFRDPALVDAALAYAASPALRPQEVFFITYGIGSWARNEDRPYAFMEANFEALRARVPEPVLAFMPQFAAGCSEERIARAEKFFAEPSRRVAGTERQLAKVAEAARDCARLRAREGAAVAVFLRAGGA